MKTNHININELVDKAKFTPFHWGVLIWCLLVIIFDGYDLVIYGVALPLLMKEWGLSPVEAGFLASTALFGMMFGALIFGPLADKIGRKPILIGSVFVFGLASLLSAFSPDMSTLVVLRFITGIGLGGAMPNAITLTSEYCPSTRRSSLVTLMFCGFTVGSALGGIVSAQLLSVVDWHGILAIGGVLPLLTLPFLL